mmetsp:Transcript_19294/g.48263  ORF Transcript_19294/g.48263 Transcript_19294/m.48263 type:complete len:273 (-) Transcript_19294:1139-1957(-)
MSCSEAEWRAMMEPCPFSKHVENISPDTLDDVEDKLHNYMEESLGVKRQRQATTDTFREHVRPPSPPSIFVCGARGIPAPAAGLPAPPPLRRRQERRPVARYRRGFFQRGPVLVLPELRAELGLLHGPEKPLRRLPRIRRLLSCAARLYARNHFRAHVYPRNRRALAAGDRAQRRVRRESPEPHPVSARAARAGRCRPRKQAQGAGWCRCRRRCCGRRGRKTRRSFPRGCCRTAGSNTQASHVARAMRPAFDGRFTGLILHRYVRNSVVLVL